MSDTYADGFVGGVCIIVALLYAVLQWCNWLEVRKKRRSDLPDERTLFERWAAKNPQRFPIAPLKNGVYPDLRTQCAWEGWKR